MEERAIIVKSKWAALKRYTDARIALGRAGVSIPTEECLRFSLSLAQAKNAVWQPFREEAIAAQLQDMGLQMVHLESLAGSKQEYLTRPDLGRRLNAESIERLNAEAIPPADILIAIGDGLSAKAVHEHAAPLIRHVLPYLRALKKSLLPVAIVRGARVAIGDEIGQLLKAKMTILLIGERPGLSSSDSLGVYVTYQPQVGRLDAERNCISNIRPQGLAYPQAALKLAWLVEHAFEGKRTGILLKDLSDEPAQNRLEMQNAVNV